MDIHKYFAELERKTLELYELANRCRKKGFDPEPVVEVSIARDLAERVEGLLGISGIKEWIKQKEASGVDRVMMAFEIAKEIASGRLKNFGGVEKNIEMAVRIGTAILTEGVLVAPTEGIARVKIREWEGRKYVSIYYAGPIRSAGGTVAALTVLLADIARREVGIPRYEATQKEVARIVEEVNIYDARVARLQYKPADEHIEIIVRGLPVEVNGEPTADEEVMVNRDLPRIETNRIRGGVPLVLCEGIAQKAKKLIKYVKKLGIDGWEWLEEVAKPKKADMAAVGMEPDYKFLDGLVAGRPVLAYPSAKGGFRLRYGRSFTNGMMARNIHPSTMYVLEGFIANGTHVKVERPGKGAVLTVNDALYPPVVRLKDGSVKKLWDWEEAKRLVEEDKIDKILFLGDMLVTFGDFLKSNHPLVPSPYVEEWWRLETALPDPKSFDEALELAREGKPLYPRYVFFWKNIEKGHLEILLSWLKKAKIEPGRIEGKIDEAKIVLEEIYCEHRVENGKIIIEGEEAKALLANLGYDGSFSALEEALPGGDVLEIIRKASGLDIRDVVGTYIGARMGRPEKAKHREMSGSPNVLFPTGIFGLRNITKLVNQIKNNVRKPIIKVEVANYVCKKCGAFSLYRKCEKCGGKCEILRKCVVCGALTKDKVHCGKETVGFVEKHINILELYESLREVFGTPANEVKGVEGLFSKDKVPEYLAKGFLRAKYGVCVFRDGTSRFDATDVPLTHVRVKDIGVSLEKLRELGYASDFEGKPLVSEEQVIKLYPQDIIISEKAAEYLIGVAKFVDDELIYIYGEKPYYNIEKKEDLIGHLVVGLSPHTSAGNVARIIGFTKVNAGFAHPYFHAAKRRNCDGDEDSIMLLLDAFLNYSKHYLGKSRGSTMDSPVILVIKIDPAEVDDEVHNMEIEPYSLEFYQKTLEMASPGDVKIRTVADVLNSDEKYLAMIITHPQSTINIGHYRTKYSLLNSIPEKIEAEIKLMRKIKAVNLRDAVERVLLDHFIPDIYGNLRQFSRQVVRCKKCNEKYRRVPLNGKCWKCGSDLLLTIHKGTIEKYVNIAYRIALEYNLSKYMVQRLELVKKEIASIFGDERRKQTNLSQFFA